MDGAKSEPQEPRRGRQQLSAIVSALGASRRSWAASKNGNRWPRLHWVVFHSTVRSFFLESTHFDRFSPSSFVHIHRFFSAFTSDRLEYIASTYVTVHKRFDAFKSLGILRTTEKANWSVSRLENFIISSHRYTIKVQSSRKRQFTIVSSFIARK